MNVPEIGRTRMPIGQGNLDPYKYSQVELTREIRDKKKSIEEVYKKSKIPEWYDFSKSMLEAAEAAVKRAEEMKAKKEADEVNNESKS